MNILNKIYLMTLMWLLTVGGYAQQAVVSAGDTYQNSQGYISWGLGETVIQTFKTTDYTLTQGFQQGDISVNAIDQTSDIKGAIQVYPNPTRNDLNVKIETDNFSDYRFQIYDLNGTLIQEDYFSGKTITISFQSKESGVYLLKVISEDQQYKALKVFKQ